MDRRYPKQITSTVCTATLARSLVKHGKCEIDNIGTFYLERKGEEVGLGFVVGEDLVNAILCADAIKQAEEQITALQESGEWPPKGRIQKGIDKVREAIRDKA